jgi:hypothetical protein
VDYEEAAGFRLGDDRPCRLRRAPQGALGAIGRETVVRAGRHGVNKSVNGER